MIGGLFVVEGLVYLSMSAMGITSSIFGLGFLEIAIGLFLMSCSFVLTAADDDMFIDSFTNYLGNSHNLQVNNKEKNFSVIHIDNNITLKLYTFANLTLIRFIANDSKQVNKDELRSMLFSNIKNLLA